MLKQPKLRLVLTPNKICVELHKINSEKERLEMTSELCDLCSNPPVAEQWIFDLSQITDDDVSLIRVLIALARGLANKGRDVSFIGLNLEIISSDLRSKVSQWIAADTKMKNREGSNAN